MTSFVHLEYATQHPGVVRIESAIVAAQHLRRRFSGTRVLAKLLLSAIAAAAMVVAWQVMDTLAEGHLLVLWTGLWVAAFVALAVFASATRHLAVRIKGGLDNWSRNIAQSRADERLWAMAQADSRVMADLQNAMAHTAQALPNKPATSHRAVFSSALLRAYQRNHL